MLVRTSVKSVYITILNIGGQEKFIMVAISFPRMHLALKSYHELLQSLCAMERLNDEELRESARVIKSKLKIE